MFAIAPTDYAWFNMLKNELLPEEMNFWTPTPWNIKKLQNGDRFYFLLKSPYRKIAGYGQFSYYINLTAKEAWNKFGQANGVNNLLELVNRASKYASKNSSSFVLTENPTIGCIVLKDLVFFDEDKYFSPADKGLSFSSEIVKLKYFDMPDIDELSSYQPNSKFELIKDTEYKYRTNLSKDRKGQYQFRKVVLKSYNNKCCISGEECLEIIEAAHIQPYINEDSNNVQNGIPLRIDFHKLFDLGLITINTDYKICVSSQLISSHYYKYNGKSMILPFSIDSYPSIKALEYHNQIIFRS